MRKETTDRRPKRVRASVFGDMDGWRGRCVDGEHPEQRESPMTAHAHSADSHKRGSHYTRLLLMIFVSFIAMYGLMYAMVNSADNVRANFNQIYMAGLMTAAMVVIELSLMWGMYDNKKLNAAIVVAGTIALVVFWIFTRQQVGISDKQFLKSMIPHHAGAILMCERAPVRDMEIKRLCRNIVSGQQAEIDQMKAKLRELDR